MHGTRASGDADRETMSPQGTVVRVSKTVSESDVYLFAGITGDLHPNHVNEHLMRKSAYGERIAHGALILAYASAASTRAAEYLDGHAVSYGYDRVRFVKAVPLGTTVTVTYTLGPVDERRRCHSEIVIHDDVGDVCMVATHILAMVDSQEPAQDQP